MFKRWYRSFLIDQTIKVAEELRDSQILLNIIHGKDGYEAEILWLTEKIDKLQRRHQALLKRIKESA